MSIAESVALVSGSLALGVGLAYLLAQGPPRWIKDIFFRPVLIPEHLRITIEDIANTGEWKKLGDTSIEKEYESPTSLYHMTIATSRNGHPHLTVHHDGCTSRKHYRRYKPTEDIELEAYKMVASHHNLTHTSPEDSAKRANTVGKDPTVRKRPT